MAELKLNETPVRTSRNFNINNIKVKDINLLEEVEKFDNISITGVNSSVYIENEVSDFDLKYGTGEVLENEVKSKANHKLKIGIKEGKNADIVITNDFDKSNTNLIDCIEIVTGEYCKANIIIKYKSLDDIEYYHNGVIRVIANRNSCLNISALNLLNTKSNNFISMDNNIDEGAIVNYSIVDFGGRNSITNYFSNLVGNSSVNSVNSIFLGKDSQVFDINYIGELRGANSNINIEVQGALKDSAKKHFKGTIDFKKGSKKAKGNENEFCMLLSDSAKSLSLPMLLCAEEDVEGNHSSAAGKVDNKELFYLESRGFDKAQAMKLIVRARFNEILSKIDNEELRSEVLEEIDLRLS